MDTVLSGTDFLFIAIIVLLIVLLVGYGIRRIP